MISSFDKVTGMSDHDSFHGIRVRNNCECKNILRMGKDGNLKVLFKKLVFLKPYANTSPQFSQGPNLKVFVAGKHLVSSEEVIGAHPLRINLREGIIGKTLDKCHSTKNGVGKNCIFGPKKHNFECYTLSL